MLRRALLVVLFLFPVPVAIVAAVAAHEARIHQVESALCHYVGAPECRDAAPAASTPAQALTPGEDKPSALTPNQGQADRVTERLNRYLADPRRYRPLTRERIHHMLYRQFTGAWITIIAFTLIPFIPLAVGLRHRFAREPLSSAQVLDGWGMRLVIAALLAMGWDYLLHPLGRGASTVYAFVKNLDPVSANTLPIVFDLAASDIRHVLVAFLGCYVHLLSVVIQRARTGDVLGGNLHRMLLRKILIVLAAAVGLSAVSQDGSLILCFLLGVFPMNALSILKDLTQKKFDTDKGDISSLALLPDTSRAAITRLEEEGIDSIPTLAFADLDALSAVIPEEAIPRRQLASWIDTARLVSALGVDKWQELCWVSRSASDFVRKVLAAPPDPAFQRALDEAKVHNAATLADDLIHLHRLPAPVLTPALEQAA
jgi:hypothetical protein